MKASEALMLGSAMIKPLIGRITDEKGEAGCALGMIVAGSKGTETLRRDHNAALPHWLGNYGLPIPLPCGCKAEYLMGSSGMRLTVEQICATVSGVLVHLFNWHVCTARDWSIERIADWLRTVEPAEPEEIKTATPIPATVEVLVEA